jgi:hypothetical protein
VIELATDVMETGKACRQCYQTGYDREESASLESKMAEISLLLT